MKPPDDVLRDHIREWIAKAEVDYRSAEWLMEAPHPIWESVGFHCQQGAEKYLKALLVCLQLEFPKTHDLEQLLDILATVRADMAEALDGIRILSPFGVKVRYPGDFPELLPGEERTLFDAAKIARETITRLLDQFLAGG